MPHKYKDSEFGVKVCINLWSCLIKLTLIIYFDGGWYFCGGCLGGSGWSCGGRKPENIVPVLLFS